MRQSYSSVLLDAARGWVRHHDARLGAALAYYAVFSLGPLLLIVVATAGLLFSPEDVRNALQGQFRSLVGPVGSQAIEAMLKGAGSREAGIVTAATGVILLVVAALGVVVQLKDALNTIWEVEGTGSGGWWSTIRTYVVSFAGVLALGFLLAISLVVNAALSVASDWLGGGSGVLWQAVNFVVSLAVLGALFAMLFRYFPDTVVAWRDAALGGVATALLFNIGKLAISWYIGTQSLQSTYGAAASVVVLLLWVYYSSQILLFGAELTRAAGKSSGSPERA